MDFGDILNQWEKTKQNKALQKKNKVIAILDEYLPDQQDIHQKIDEETEPPLKTKRKSLLFSDDDVIDLHGYSLEEARKNLSRFLERRYQKSSKSVLIIHGKGNHNIDGMSKLKEMTHELCRNTDFIGRFEKAPAHLGGSGATCLYFKRKANVDGK